MKVKKESFFWTSYSDLMTSLFFVMLILFVVTVCILHKRIIATQSELEAIKKVEESTKDLPKEYFLYNDEYEKFVLKIQCKFELGKSEIKDSASMEELYKAGVAICAFLHKYQNYSYLLIVEGQASKDDYQFNYELSYNRAKSLIEFWNSKDDIHNAFGNRCEVLIAGSGDNKIALGKQPMRDNIEMNNQRFIIHIIPKNIIRNEMDMSQRNKL